MILTSTNYKSISSYINSENFNILKEWLINNDDLNNKPYDIDKAYLNTIYDIQQFLYQIFNKKIHIENLNEINDIYHTNDYNFLLDCILFLPFVNIYRCYICYENDNIEINHIGNEKINLKKNDIIIFNYNKDHYRIINNESRLLRLNFITFNNIYMYPYIKLIKLIIYYYEIYYIKHILDIYLKKVRNYNLNIQSSVVGHIITLKILSILDIYIGLNNIFFYIIFNDTYVYKKYYKHITIFFIIENIIKLKNKKTLNIYIFRNILINFLYNIYAISYSTLALE